MIKKIHILFFFIAFFNYNSYSLHKIHNLIFQSDSNKFNFKTGIKENGIYYHFGKLSEFKHEKIILNEGWYVITECFTDINIMKEEVNRYFNFGFPDADFFIQPDKHYFFLSVYFATSKQEAINKVIEIKAAGVPHVWIYKLEE